MCPTSCLAWGLGQTRSNSGDTGTCCLCVSLGPVCLQSNAGPPTDCKLPTDQDHLLVNMAEIIPPVR